MNDISPAQVVKGGETCLEVAVRRDSEGIRLSVKVHPRVEEFMRNASAGQQANVHTFNRTWNPVSKDAPPLMAYFGGAKFPAQTSDDGTSYTLEHLGQPLLVGAGGVAPFTNMSFLRLVGASEGAGVTFTIKGVFSMEQLRQIRDRISYASRRFYIDYIRPVDLSVTVSTQELKL